MLELQPDFHNVEGSNEEAGYLRQKLTVSWGRVRKGDMRVNLSASV